MENGIESVLYLWLLINLTLINWWSYQRQITKKEDKKTKQQKLKQNHMKQE